METKLISGKFGAQVALTVNNVDERITLKSMYHFFDELGAMKVFDNLQADLMSKKKAEIKAKTITVKTILEAAIGKMLDLIPFELYDYTDVDASGNAYVFRAIRLQEGESVNPKLQAKIDATNAAKAELDGLADGFFE